MSTPEEALIKAAGDAVSAPIRDILHKLTGPWAEQIGLSFGDAAKVYRLKRAVRLLEKVKTICADAGVDPHRVSPRVLVPTLEYASLEDDEELHSRWASLLANAATGSENNVPPYFPDILHQLSPLDARVLNCLYGLSVGRENEVSFIGELEAIVSYVRQDNILATELEHGDLSLCIENLERLGLIARVKQNSDDPFTPAKIYQSGEHVVFATGTFEETDQFYTTRLGIRFMKACRPPIKG